MTPDRPQPTTSVQPISSIDDPRAITLLTTEHWSLLGARSLAYNEAFVRAGIFLTFLSMSFVGLALLAQAMSFGTDFLGVAALVLTFDLIVGLASFIRIGNANVDDLRALHAMARIRHAYTQITPLVKPYYSTPIHDDIDAVVAEYGTIGNSLAAQFLYGLTTSAGVIALTVAMVGGVLAAVVAMLIGFHGAAVWIGLVAGLVVLGGLFAYAAVMVPREQARLIARFPTPATEPATDQPM